VNAPVGQSQGDVAVLVAAFAMTAVGGSDRNSFGSVRGG